MVTSWGRSSLRRCRVAVHGSNFVVLGGRGGRVEWWGAGLRLRLMEEESDCPNSEDERAYRELWEDPVRPWWWDLPAPGYGDSLDEPFNSVVRMAWVADVPCMRRAVPGVRWAGRRRSLARRVRPRRLRAGVYGERCRLRRRLWMGAFAVGCMVRLPLHL